MHEPQVRHVDLARPHGLSRSARRPVQAPVAVDTAARRTHPHRCAHSAGTHHGVRMSTEPLRVLLVEDQRFDAMLVQDQLKRAKALGGREFEVVHANCFVSAFELLSYPGAAFDVVLLDLGLPDVSGLDGVEKLRRSFPNVPVVVLTGHEDLQIAEDAVATGAQDFLVKGWKISEMLVRAIHYAIARQHIEQLTREREAEHRALFQANPQPIWVYDVQTLRFLEVNAAAQRHYGWSREEFLAMRITDIRPPEEAPALLDHLSLPAKMRDGTDLWRHWTRDGRSLLAEVSAHSITFHGREARLVLATDVTELRMSLTALRASEQRFRDLFENSLGLICEHDIAGVITAINPAAARALGYEPGDLVGTRLHELVPEPYRMHVPTYLETIVREGQFSGLMTVQTRDGHWRAWRFNNRLHELPTGRKEVIGHAQDLTDSLRHEQELQDQSLTDPLTKSRNRRYLDHLLHGNTLADWGCIMIDLDGFKGINDNLGHERGDRVLVDVAEFLKKHTRGENDVVIRMGGDEFLVLLMNAAASHAGELAQRLLAAVPAELSCGISLGWSVREAGEALERTIAHADRMLYDLRRERRGVADSLD
jgi:diguanylate cyclase (GGDEF)-like protein/PAS domain S-box-containing protein